jgi:hypothetical protein
VCRTIRRDAEIPRDVETVFSDRLMALSAAFIEQFDIPLDEARVMLEIEGSLCRTWVARNERTAPSPEWSVSTYSKGDLRIRWSVSGQEWQLIDKVSRALLHHASTPEELEKWANENLAGL